MLYKSIEQTIGNTPLVELGRIKRRFGLESDIFAKVEFFNPGGSVKDRPAMKMLDDAFEDGRIRKGSVIIEPTSGNTGIGLALASVKYDLRLKLVMPSSLSRERIALMKALGAEVILTEPAEGMKGAIGKARELLKENSGAFMPMQFENPSNPAAHFEATAREIQEDLGGTPDIFVAGVGTGGTITGCGSYFKIENPDVRIIAAEPSTSAVLSGDSPGKHGIQGIGAGFVPPVLDTGLIDEIIKVPTEKALEFSRLAGTEEKILCGISSGAALYAAVEAARAYPGKKIVTLFPDTGERYLSTALFSDQD